MKHINKPLGVTLNVLEQKGKDRRAITEGVNIFVLILLGCSGLYLYTNIAFPKEPNIHFSNMTANTVIAVEDEPSETMSTQGKSDNLAKELLIEGHQEAGEQVWVSFEDFNKKANYRIDFGDGHTQRMTSKSISHVYGKKGKFKVELIINYKNEPIKRISKAIYIDEAIEVTSDASQER